MSYTFLLAAGEESSAECFSDIAPCALSRSTPTADESYYSDNETASCHTSQSGTTCEPSMAVRGEGGLSWSPLASHAKTSPTAVLPAPALRANAPDSGERRGGWFAKLSHDTCSWKIQQLSLLSGLDEYSATWPRFGMMRDGECFRVETWEHDTSVRGSFCLPAVTASCARRGHGLSGNLANLRMKKSTVERTTRISKTLSWRWPRSTLEWMMGFPIRWTAFEPLATHKFQQWSRSHGGLSKQFNNQAVGR